jgi:DNA-binding response OmpR family regulator
MIAKLLWIEGKRANSPSFVPTLQNKGYEVEIVSTGREAVDRLEDVNPDLAVVNAASFRSSGKRICNDIRNQVDGLPIILIVDETQKMSGEVCANTILRLPFTSRKLVNRIVPLLPGEGENTMQVGDVFLDLERKQVKCQGREAQLTPKLTQLLQALMERVGEVFERDKLFRKVWNTEYTGDTRTLDVHISWLRQAIEEDPRKPKYLITVRGMGYRLDA